MTPYERAARIYQSEACARSFREDFEAHLFNGYVFNTPRLFLMGRPVSTRWPKAGILNPEWATAIKSDCWHVWLAAGDLREAIRLMPYPLPFVSFERKNRLIVMPMAKLLRMFTP